MCIYKLSTVVICLCRVLLVTGPWHDLFTVLVWKKMLLLTNASPGIRKMLSWRVLRPACTRPWVPTPRHPHVLTEIETTAHTGMASRAYVYPSTYMCSTHTHVQMAHRCVTLLQTHNPGHLMSCTTTFKVQVMRRETAESSLHTHHKVFVLSPPLPKWKNK